MESGMSLRVYKQKRNFKKTPEPAGKVGPKKGKSLYIIQKHAASHLHYDFRLELNGVLLSWAVPKGPCLDPSVKRLAMHVEDHPLAYGSFQGIIPKGQYGGGTVMLWDQGKWICEDDNPTAAYHKGDLTFQLQGAKLKGRWKLIRMRGNDKTWLLMKLKDEYAAPIKKFDITAEEPNSVLNNETMEEITENYAHVWSKNGLEKAPKRKTTKPAKTLTKKKISLDLKHFKKSVFPKDIYPELATLVDEPPKGKEWLHEIKLDGYRLIAFKKNNRTWLKTRNNNDWTNQFQIIADEINKLPIDDIILDGEVVLLDQHQHSDFQLLQNSIKNNQDKPFIYYTFDLLYYKQYNLMHLPLIERKNLLKKIIAKNTETLRYSDHVVGSGDKVFQKSCELGLEGIVSKNCQSSYAQKRTLDWLKIKCLKRQEFVIGGFNPPKGKRKFFGSLLLGTFNKRNEFVYNGNVGTGFTEASLKSLYELFQKYKTDQMPFAKRPPGSSRTIWLKPVLIAEIEFSDWTEDNALRHPSFKGLRTDKPPKTVIKEKETPVENITKTATEEKSERDYKLTNPHKILYPEDQITKEDVANYYDKIHKWILPYIINRPLTLVRCPKNYQDCFFQKHIGEHSPSSVNGIMIKEKESKGEYIYIKDRAGLLALAQMGALELHPWGSQVDDVEYPDIIIFDLDPAPDVPWKKVVEAAFDVKKYLTKLKLKSFVKTTGGKGLHVAIPIKPKYDWEEIKNFAHAFVDYLVMKSPEKYVGKMTKAIRKGKIFIDYMRNQRGATFVAPYSTRARKGAPVSTPIDWNELTDNINDTFYTIKTLPDRLKKLKKDPWKNFLKSKQTLKL